MNPYTHLMIGRGFVACRQETGEPLLREPEFARAANKCPACVGAIQCAKDVARINKQNEAKKRLTLGA